MKTFILAACCLIGVSTSLQADRHDRVLPPSSTEHAAAGRPPRHDRMPTLSTHATERIIELAREVSFNDDRMRLLEAALLERHVTCAQCVRLMDKLADFDDERLDIVRLIGGRIADPENISIILDEFSFTSDRDKARDMLRPRR